MSRTPNADDALTNAPAAPHRIEVPVLIAGAGPVGLTAANLLGLRGVETLIIERETTMIDYPRAVAMDDEGLRIVQALGLLDPVQRETRRIDRVLYVSPRGTIAEARPSPNEGGLPRLSTFIQPILERQLREALSRFEHVELHLGCELQSFVQDRNRVTARVQRNDGTIVEVACRYLLACDGGRSTARKTLGIELRGSTYRQDWLVIDIRDDPVPAEHIQFDCDPHRPVVSLPLPRHHRRWEFMRVAGETLEDLESPDSIRRLLAPWGEPDDFEIIRRKVYTFHARLAERLHAGRVFLLGDAAHLMPPFAGQGLMSGLRDAFNLCWKLDLVLRGDAHPDTLSSYDLERRPHVRAMIRLTRFLGSIIMPTSRFAAALRDWLMRVAQLIPGGKRFTAEMRIKPAPRIKEGLLLGRRAARKQSRVGRLLVQPRVRLGDGSDRLLDDVLGEGFALLGWRVDPAAHLDADARRYWQHLGARVVCAAPAGTAAQVGDETIAVEDGGALAGWFKAGVRDVLFIRPDRIVAAACAAPDVGHTTRALRALLQPAAATHPDRLAS